MDASLASLLAELASAQEAKSTVRLSERTVVDLVTKLKDRGILAAGELIATSASASARGFVTRPHLRRELVALVNDQGGRLGMIDAAAAMGVDLAHVEEAARDVAEANEVMLLAGEMLSPTYFDHAAEEVADELAEVGILGVADVAKRLGLPADVVAEHVTPRAAAAAGSHGARVEGGMLYTNAHASRVDAALRGALRAAVAPADVHDLAKLGGVGASASLVSAAAQRAVSEKWAAGSLRGGGRWAPDIFETAREDGVRALFAAAGAACYDEVKRLGVSDPAALLATLFPDATAYAHSRVGATAAELFDASTSAALKADGVVDAALHLPSGVHDMDAGAVLRDSDTAKAAAKDGALVGIGAGGTCIVSKEVLDACVTTAVAYAQECARAQLAAVAAATASASSAASTTGKGSSGGGKAAAATARLADDGGDDDWSVGPKKGKGGKKAKGGSGGSKAASKKDAAPSSSSEPTAASGKKEPPSLRELTAILIKENPILDGLGGDAGGDDCSDDDACAAVAIAVHVFPAARDAHTAALASALTAEAETRKMRRAALLDAAQAGAEKVRPLLRGAACLADPDADGDATAAAASRRMATNGPGSEVADALVRVLCLDARVSPEDKPDNPKAPMGLSASERKAAVASLESAAKEDSAVAGAARAASALVELLGRGGGEVASDDQEDVLEQALSAVAEESGCRLRWPDRKAEKALAAKQAEALMTSLRLCVDARTAGSKPPLSAEDTLVALVGMHYASKLSRCVLLPGKAVAGAVARLRSVLDEDAHVALVAFQQAVTVALKDQKDDDARDGLYDQLASLL